MDCGGGRAGAAGARQTRKGEGKRKGKSLLCREVRCAKGLVLREKPADKGAIRADRRAPHAADYYDRDFLLGLYKKMVLIREFEEGVKFLFLEGTMPGTIHQCQGQEATAVGVCAALERGISSRPPFGATAMRLAKGSPSEELLFELFGASTGCCRGKGGSMHVGNMDEGMVPGIAIVGGGIPLAAGMALAFKMRKNLEYRRLFFWRWRGGRGGIPRGSESCRYLGRCPSCLSARTTSMAPPRESIGDAQPADRRPRSRYGIRGETVDGNDVLAVHEAATSAAADAGPGGDPVLLELLTYRRTGHSRRDTCHYQPQEEREDWFHATRSSDSASCSWSASGE